MHNAIRAFKHYLRLVDEVLFPNVSNAINSGDKKVMADWKRGLDTWYDEMRADFERTCVKADIPLPNRNAFAEAVKDGPEILDADWKRWACGEFSDRMLAAYGIGPARLAIVSAALKVASSMLHRMIHGVLIDAFKSADADTRTRATELVDAVFNQKANQSKKPNRHREEDASNIDESGGA
jgi:hypothetical protein